MVSKRLSKSRVAPERLFGLITNEAPHLYLFSIEDYVTVTSSVTPIFTGKNYVPVAQSVTPIFRGKLPSIYHTPQL